MYQTVNETVPVVVAFRGNRIVPILFEWGGKRYRVKAVNLIHAARNGDGKVLFFNVSDEANSYKLAFDSKKLEWELQEVYAEG